MNKDEAQKVAEATIKKMSEKKPKWFESHEKSDTKEFWAIRSTLKSQDAILADLQKSHDLLIKIQEEYHEKTTPVFEYLNEITVGRKIRKDYIDATGTWIKILLGISALAGTIWAVFKFMVFNVR